MLPKRISLHPALAAALEGMSGFILLFLFPQVISHAHTAEGLWWYPLLWLGGWFLLRIGWWAALIYCMYYPPFVNRWRHLWSLALFQVAVLFFLLFSDWKWGGFLVRILFVFIPVVSFFLTPSKSDELSVISKPHRRWRFLMSAFGLGGLWGGIVGLRIFQLLNGWLFWLVVVGMAALTAVVSSWWWYEYKVEGQKKIYLGAAALFLLMLELSCAIIILPIGHMVSGFLFVWLWYILWLMFRFHFLPEGINWRKQTIFLGINLAFLAFFLAGIVRWK